MAGEAQRTCGCPHGCDAMPDDQGRCPICWNRGEGCPFIWKQQTKGSWQADPVSSGEKEEA